MREVRRLFADLEVEVLSLKEAHIDVGIVEDGSTFGENALIKARAVHQRTGGMVLADDSGLEIDFLNKEPGIYSSRYCGEETPYGVKNALILERMAGVPQEKRTARFVCAMAVILENGEEITAQASFEGQIGEQAQGEEGFGYDPIFYLPERGCTAAQLSIEEKNKISHRGKALQMIKEKLKAVLIQEKA